MIRYVDEHRDRFGVEPICRVLCATEGGFLTLSRVSGSKDASEVCEIDQRRIAGC